MEHATNRIADFYHTQIAPYLYDRVLVISVVIVLLVLLMVVGALRRRARPIRVFKTTSGRVQVTRGAIRDLVLNACRYVQAAHKPKVHIKARRGRLYIRIDLRLNEDQRLNDVAVQLQTRIEDILQDTLSLDRRSVRIDVGLKGIRHTKTPVPVEEPSALEPVPDVAPVDSEKEPEPLTTPAIDPDEAVSGDEPEDEDAAKTKRGFFGFGRRKKAESEETEAENDEPESDYDAGDDPFAPKADEEDDKKKF